MRYLVRFSFTALWFKIRFTWNCWIPCESTSGCADGGDTRSDLLVGPSGRAARPRPFEMRDDIDHERDARRECEAKLKRLCVYQSDKRSEYAFSQLENEQRSQALRDDMSSGRREIASLHRQLETLVRDHKNLLAIL